MTLDFDTVRARASLPTRTVSLCLAGELVEQADQLEKQVAAVGKPTSLGDTTRKDLLTELAAVQEQMSDAMVEFKLRAMPARAWTTFWANRPEKADGETEDAYPDRMFAYWAQMLSRCCVEPAMTEAQVGELADLLHGRAWSLLVNQCITLNMDDVDLPNFDAASALSQDSAQT